MHKQWFVANPALGVRVFSGYFWRNNGQEVVLIKFVSAGKDIEDEEFRCSEKYGHHGFFVPIVVFVLGGTSTRDFA
jgi:hypothetical protein